MQLLLAWEAAVVSRVKVILLREFPWLLHVLLCGRALLLGCQQYELLL
jgi:hypothetical protein